MHKEVVELTGVLIVARALSRRLPWRLLHGLIKKATATFTRA